MHILYLIQYFGIPEDSPAADRSYQFIETFLNEGHSVTVITTDAFISDPEKYTAYESRHEHLNLHIIHQPYANNFSAFARLLAFMGYLFKGFARLGNITTVDLIYASSTPLTTGILGWLAHKILHKPWFFEIRDLWPDFPIQILPIRSALVKKALYRIEHKLYASADHIVTLSPTATDMLTDNKQVSASNILTLPNGCTIPFYKQGRSRESIMADPNRHLLIYAGTLGRANDIPWVLAYYGRLLELDEQGNYEFAIIGSGSERSKVLHWYQHLTSEQKSRVHLVTRIPRTQAADWYHHADCCLITFLDLPVLRATSPTKFFDGLASGTVPVTNHQGWVGDFIQSQEIGICWQDIETAAVDTHSLLKTTPKLQAKKQKATQLAATFRRDEMAQQLLQHFKKNLQN